MSERLASCRSVTVEHVDGDSRVAALLAVDLDIEEHDRLALVGRSGSGKTTLLHVLGGLVAPTEGSVEWRGVQLSTLDAAARARTRAHGIAYVFQGANLFPHLTAFENVAFAARVSRNDREGPAPLDLIAMVGLSDRADSLPSELSGGEAQRVALARALAQRPLLLLCDEPTGQLDSDTGDRVLDLIDGLQHAFGFALVTATHDADVAARYGREVELDDGRVVRVGAFA
ncbi:MAG: putative transport system ATP-binding protein [Gaiellales bacterium]|jgi:putative ABC transport system ATP-binding protein|nr:putative transport system ATP-binding protein [Gaiellales bacterium]